jgi:hypothetical protein
VAGVPTQRERPAGVAAALGGREQRVRKCLARYTGESLMAVHTQASPVLAGAAAPAGASLSGIPPESCKITT